MEKDEEVEEVEKVVAERRRSSSEGELSQRKACAPLVPPWWQSREICVGVFLSNRVVEAYVR